MLDSRLADIINQTMEECLEYDGAYHPHSVEGGAGSDASDSDVDTVADVVRAPVVLEDVVRDGGVEEVHESGAMQEDMSSVVVLGSLEDVPVSLPRSGLPRRCAAASYLEPLGVTTPLQKRMVEAWRSLSLRELRRTCEDRGVDVDDVGNDKTGVACALVAARVPLMHEGSQWVTPQSD